MSRIERSKAVLEDAFKPTELVIEDESHQHAGHYESDQDETHLALRIVSEAFESMSLVKRHQAIYKLLNDELQSGLHALKIDARPSA